MNTYQQLVQYLSDPWAWVGLGALVIHLIFVAIYDQILSWLPDQWSDWWTKRAQWWLKIAVYAAVLCFVLLVGFTPWPVNVFIVVTAVLAVASYLVWRRGRQGGQQQP